MFSLRLTGHWNDKTALQFVLFFLLEWYHKITQNNCMEVYNCMQKSTPAPRSHTPDCQSRRSSLCFHRTRNGRSRQGRNQCAQRDVVRAREPEREHNSDIMETFSFWKLFLFFIFECEGKNIFQCGQKNWNRLGLKAPKMTKNTS